MLAAWVERYLEPVPEPQTIEELRGDSGVTASTSAGAFRTEIRFGAHSIVAGEPKAVGGENLGPTPYDLLASALGACTTMTLQMYAARKEWPLEQAVVTLKHSRVHEEDEERCETADARMDRLDRDLTLVGPLSAEQRQRLLEIADRCPVHRTLSAGVRIATRLEDGLSSTS